MQSLKLMKLFALLVGMIVTVALPLYSHAQGTATTLQGTIVQISRAGDDTLIQLDTNGDGSADALLKLDPSDQVLDAQGQPVSANQLDVGMVLTVPLAQFDQEDGYYEIVKEGAIAGQQTPLTGTVIDVAPDDGGSEVYVLLDTDGDGIADARVKLEPGDAVLGPDGQPVDLSSITAGTVISVVAYRYDADSGTFEGKSTQDDDGPSSDNETMGDDSDNDEDSGDSQDDDQSDDSGDDEDDDSEGADEDEAEDD